LEDIFGGRDFDLQLLLRGRDFEGLRRLVERVVLEEERVHRDVGL
jgi:hypothetical protein